ncbi:MAG TPA: signal peptidase I [Mobilitalea sp.]|nr:signal peptidase I [Mobilitalea sp.]
MNDVGYRVVSTHELFPVIQESLETGQKVIFTVSGTSMLPWIAHNRDQVLLAKAENKKLKKGDIILFLSESGKYILHRIYKVNSKGYNTIGDACQCDDGVVHTEQIIGKVEKIYRKDKEINCDSFLWWLIFAVWRWLLPIRGLLLEIYYLLVQIKRWLKKKHRIRRLNHGKDCKPIA